MLNVSLLTYFTKKLDLVIIEENDSISSKYGDYLNSIFKEIKIYNCQEEFLFDIEKNNFDILLFDNNIHNVKSTFFFVKNVHNINPLLKIILFSKYVDYYILMNCLKYNISGFMSTSSDIQDLKDFLKVSVKRILMNNNNRFGEDSNKFDVIDCLNFLKNEQLAINLVNHYKGIPIIKPAQILNFNNDSIILKIDSIQMKTIKEKEHVVISSLHLGVEILTETKCIKYKENEIVLKFNRFIDSYVHHRKKPRIEPSKDSKLVIESKSSLPIDIINISIDNVLCNLTNYDTDLEIHSNVQISINCDFDIKYTKRSNYMIKTRALVKEIFYTNDSKKVLFKFKLNEKDNLILDKYIENRMKVLIKELKNKTI